MNREHVDVWTGHTDRCDTPQPPCVWMPPEPLHSMSPGNPGLCRISCIISTTPLIMTSLLVTCLLYLALFCSPSMASVGSPSEYAQIQAYDYPSLSCSHPDQPRLLDNYSYQSPHVVERLLAEETACLQRQAAEAKLITLILAEAKRASWW